MELKKVFREISKQLQSDFLISTQIKHNSSKGTFRENALWEFLSEGRLPKKYGVGSGEIVGLEKATSRQSDIIIYDNLDGIPLIYSESNQVFPVESIYGTIEVKSSLSKDELITALENIKSVKELAPKDKVILNPIPGISIGQERPVPFGIIFAYSLAGNSLNSLEQNLSEWEQSVSPRFWPNLIVILNEGLIYHTLEMMQGVYATKFFSTETNVWSFPWKNDTLLHFYIILLDLCNSIKLRSVNLSTYLDLPTRVGKYLVKNYDRWIINDKDNPRKKTAMKLSLDFIDRIATYCKGKGKITQREILIKQTGQIPIGCSENFLNQLVYFYDPENLPGLHEVSDPFEKDESGNFINKTRMLIPGYYIEIDGESYYFSGAYVQDNDLEVNPDKSVEDIFD